ncbi:glycoside hydrolase family 35 protein [Patellaria atrata CBS 101060]|uniref:beta-galactosidase n=1 Tax=Patellaria atrata CBS 101060 TaxID=1346257 RepID=A0A9P4SEE2_9PEZI|nr:glycoside hydrolase family 35 protein [Patellaria atrata CBS 101060]
MRLSGLLFILKLFLLSTLATDDGLTNLVSWDKYSLMINGERIFIMSGEFAYQRLPVPELWLDVFQKFKANGLNTVSIYFFWSYHSPSRGVYDFTTPAKDIQIMLDMAQQAGLYVIARPGPYCNAETNAGGFALWTSDGSGGRYRTSDETYHQAWLPWIQEVGAILERNQITKGGPVILVQIENELQQGRHDPNDTLVLYMEQLKKAMRDAGIVVPLTHNEKGMRAVSWTTDYQDVGGSVNIYGLDNYPGGLSCANPETGFNLNRGYYQWFQNYSFTQPEYLPEFEAGWFQPWGAAFYDDCLSEHDPAFADVYYKSVIGQRVTLLNLYMAFGGTNWGQSAATVVYTSYDYSAPLRETREVQDKFKHTKLVGLFTRVSQDLWKTNMESNGTGNAVDNRMIWTWVLRNPDTGSRFYLAENNISSSRAVTDFAMTVNTSAGPVSIATMQLNGRQSRFVVTDYPIGNMTLLYSSAEVLTYGVFNRPVVVFYLKKGQTGEFAFKSPSQNTGYYIFGSESDFRAINDTSNGTRYTYTTTGSATVIEFSNGLLAYLLDTNTAYKFFAPSTTDSPVVKPNQQIFVFGPYLVRKASITGRNVEILGDNDEETTIEVYIGDTAIDTIQWNGKSLNTTRTPYGSLTATIPGGNDRNVDLPTLNNWKVKDSLPEMSLTYDDSAWTVANKTTTRSPVAPLTLPVLFSSDYGFYTGIKLYRARFDGRAARAVNLTVQGGAAAGWNAWLNSQFIGGSPGQASAWSTSGLLEFGDVALLDRDNILTVVTDYHGHDQTSTGPAGGENPRGILGATLFGERSTKLSFKSWKIQGNAGGDEYIDPVRGPMNEGGLYGERLGWHLPGFNTSGWESESPLQGLSGPGIRWYTTTFELNIDEDLDVPLGIELSALKGTVARVQIFVNGYQYGKYVPHIGPQTTFPVPPGIINNRGMNTLSLSLWAQEKNGAKLDKVELIGYDTYQTGFSFNIDGRKLQPGWTEDRLQYA